MLLHYNFDRTLIRRSYYYLVLIGRQALSIDYSGQWQYWYFAGSVVDVKILTYLLVVVGSLLIDNAVGERASRYGFFHAMSPE